MKDKLALYVFVDAFGYEVYKRYNFLPEVLKNNRRLKTVFGFSSAADPSILTGRYPEEHGHWSSFYYSPETSPFKIMKIFKFLPPSIFDRWRIRHWMSKIIAKLYRFTGYFEMYSIPFKYIDYFDYLEKYDYFVPGGIIKTDTIFDYCHENSIDYHCSNWRLSEKENIEIAKNQIKNFDNKFIYLYLPKLDAVMHAYGTKHDEVEKKIRSLEEKVLDVYNLACTEYKDVSLYLISDHGMTDVKRSLPLISHIEKSGLKYGSDYIAMYDSTMARFWFLNKKAEKDIREILEKIDDGYIVNKEELKDMHCFFPDRMFGDMFFLINPGVLLCPSYMGLKQIPGMHGYHPDDKDSDAMMLSNKTIPDGIKSITNIRETMEMELP